MKQTLIPVIKVIFATAKMTKTANFDVSKFPLHVKILPKVKGENEKNCNDTTISD
jgi:hypothetical protein